MSWPVYLVVASHVHSHICCVTGVMALKKARFAHRHIAHCFSITIYLKAKIFPHFWSKLCWGWRNLRFCVGFRHFASLFDGSLTSLSWKSFHKEHMSDRGTDRWCYSGGEVMHNEVVARVFFRQRKYRKNRFMHWRYDSRIVDSCDTIHLCIGESLHP